MKNKRLIIILSSIMIVVFAAFISIGVIYAEATNAGQISYMYNTSIAVPEFDYSINENKLEVTNKNDTLNLLNYDLIIEANDEPFDGYSPSKVVEKENINHYLYKNIPINSTLSFKNEVSYDEDSIRIIPLVASFKKETINYRNAYVSNQLDLELVSFSNSANFSINTLFQKKNYANVIYLIDDVTLSKNITINTASSLDCGKYTLTLDNELKIRHNFVGRYYVNGTITNLDNFSLIAENAQYDFYGSLEGITSDKIITNGKPYNGILEEAISYIEKRIPKRIYSDSIQLYRNFMMYDVTYSYQIAYGDSESYQDIFSETNVIELFARGEDTKDIKIKITASDGINTSTPIIVSSQIIGKNATSLINAIGEELKDTYGNNKNDSIDLLSVLSETYSYEYNTDVINTSIIISINKDSTDIDSKLNVNGTILDENEIELVYENGEFKYGTDKVDTLFIQKGKININPVCVVRLSLSGTDANTSVNLEMTNSSNEQIKDYISEFLNIFTTNEEYKLLNLRDSDLYEGNSKLFSVNGQIKNVEYNIIKNDIIIEKTIYFSVKTTDDGIDESLSIIDVNDDVEGLYLVYTLTFDNDETKTITIPISKVTSTDPSEENNFKSNNPFDDVFQIGEVNWIKGTTFDFTKLTDYSEKDYASIEIVSIDGTNYDGTPINRVETLRGKEYSFDISKIITVKNNEQYKSTIDKIGKTVYRKIDINVDLNYIPTWNTNVVFKCMAYEEDQLIVEQNYTIVIPGIYKCYNEQTKLNNKTPFVFQDSNLYNLTIELLKKVDSSKQEADETSKEDSKYINLYDEKKSIYYILSDVQECDMELDYTSIQDTCMSNGLGLSEIKNLGLDLTGLEQFINIPSIILKGFKLNEISSYNYYEGTALINMNLSHCNLTDSILFDEGSNISNLYNIYLETIDLSNNYIAKTNNLIYRSCINLNLSNQFSTLSDISGLSTLNLLQVLDVSYNSIYRFEPIKTISSLKTVKCYKNDITNMKSYGSQGKINLPVYVWMIKENDTKIFNLENTGCLQITDQSKENFITQEEIDACTYLNSFAMQTKLYTNDIAYINDDISSITKGDSYVSYRKIGGGTNTGIDASNVTSYYILENGNFVKATVYSTSTIYYERLERTYEFTCRFSGVNSDDILDKMILINENFGVDSIINPSAIETKASYIISIISGENVVASREFECTLYCSYNNGGN